MKTYAASTILYLGIGFLTFALVYDQPGGTRTDKELGSVIAGVIWPIYWGGRASIAVVHQFKQGICT